MKITIPEFQKKYPKLINSFEKETGKNAIYYNKINNQFIKWIIWIRQKKDIWNNHIPEFFLNFLKEHHYFSLKILVGIYIDKEQPPTDKYDIIKSKFKILIRRFKAHKIISKYSSTNYKVNKDNLKKELERVNVNL